MRLDEVILRGTRASQPAATSRPGWLYCVTDEGNIVERSNGTAWEAYSPSAGGSGGSPSVNDFRLTLASGQPVYAPQPATPSSTDTTGDTCTFAAAHGWTNGTIATVSVTGGGLTAGTRYYINAVSGTVVSFHTTVANALAGTSKVDLTASITAQVIPSGISNTTLYLSPYIGSTIGLYTGTAWAMLTSAEVSIALGTLTANTNYDVFAYNNSGVPALELGPAWTSDTVRSTALTRQNGIWVKSGDATRRYLGTFRTDTTTTTIDDAGGIAVQVGGKRYVWNISNQLPRMMKGFDTGTWNYATNAWRQANGATGNKLEWVNGLPVTVTVTLNASTYTSSASSAADTGINFDSVTKQPEFAVFANLPSGYAGTTVTVDQDFGIGYHYAAWMEAGNGVTTIQFMGRAGLHQSGLSGKLIC